MRIGRYLNSLLLSRAVDLFDTYLVQVIAEVVELQPALLRTSHEVRLDYVLRFEDMDDLRRDLVERLATRLGSEGLDAIESWFEKSLGISDMHTATSRSDTIEAIATRNVLTHNHGRVDRRFRQKVPGTKRGLGDEVVLGESDLRRMTEAVLNTVDRIDKAVVAKFPDLDRD